MVVESPDTVLSVKKKLERIFHTPVREQYLTFKSRPLRNDSTLSNNCIGFDDTIDLVLTERYEPENFLIYCKEPNGFASTFFVRSSHTVSHIKDLIFSSTGNPPERLSLHFEGKPLIDERTISYYNIEKESTIYIVSESYGN